MAKFDRDAVAAALREHGSIAASAQSIGVDRRRLSEFVNADPSLKALRWGPSAVKRPSLTVKGDDAEFEMSSRDLGELETLVTARGLDPDEWYVTALKCWQTYHGEDRTTAFLKRTIALQVISPAVHVPDVLRTRMVERAVGRPELIVVEGDEQAPYQDVGLDACATAFWADTQPDEAVFYGDLVDFPTISRHGDHPSTMPATPQVCIDAAYGILRRRVEASPNTRIKFLKGNHDWRLESELLARSERLHGISPAGESLPFNSLRRLLQFDALGIELVEDVRGWEHAEVAVVPGGNGLVVRHGLVTGENTARRTLAKLGRSAIVGHGHQKEAAYRLTYPKHRLQQGFVAGCMCEVNGRGAHFTVNPDWHQGFVTVTRWPDGTFLLEHAVYHRGSLYWRDKRWNSADYLEAS